MFVCFFVLFSCVERAQDKEIYKVDKKIDLNSSLLVCVFVITKDLLNMSGMGPEMFSYQKLFQEGCTFKVGKMCDFFFQFVRFISVEYV